MLVFAQQLLHIFHLGKLRILGERHHVIMIITAEEGGGEGEGEEVEGR